MIIIDKTKTPSPILVHKPKPKHFNTTYDQQKYYAQRKKEDIEGIGDVPPTLVHKTQEQWIKDRDSGVIFRPTCRDVDLMIHQEIADCRKKGEALVIIKGRGVGLSTEFGCLGNYFMKMYPGTTTLLTSQVLNKIRTLFSDKVALTYDRYDEEIRPVELRRNETNAHCYLKTEQEYLDLEGRRQVNTSQIICRETSDTPKSASAFSGEGAIFGAYDELFLHGRRRELIRSSASCYVNARTRTTTGFLLAGGTCEDTLSNEQLSDLHKMILSIQKEGMLETMPARLLFIPSWMGTFMTNGWSDEKKGTEWWEKQCEMLDKGEDKSALRAFRMNNPMKLEDIFELTSGNRFEDDVSASIKLQIDVLKKNPPKIWKGNFVSLGHTVQTAPATKPTVKILEQPRENINYYLLVDGVASGSETGSEKGSNLASTVIKTIDSNSGKNYSPVCLYSERPKTVEQGYLMIANQLRYYHQFGGVKGIMAEANAGVADSFSSFLQREGLGKFVMNRKDSSGKGNSDIRKLFTYITVDIRQYQYTWMNMFLRKYVQNIEMIEYLEQMLKPLDDNTDELDSLLLLPFVLPKNYDQPIEKKRVSTSEIRQLITENGVTKYKWISR